MFCAEKWCAKAKGRPRAAARRALKPEEPSSQTGGGAGTGRRRGWSPGPGRGRRGSGGRGGRRGSRRPGSGPARRAAGGSRRHPRPGGPCAAGLPRWRRPCRGSAEAQVDAARRHRLQRAELLRDDERGVVREHHAARAEADAAGVCGEVGENHGRRRGGHARHGVVLGDPVAVEAALFGEAGQLDAGTEGVGGGVSRTDGHQVQYGEGGGGRALRCAPYLVCRHGEASCVDAVRCPRQYNRRLSPFIPGVIPEGRRPLPRRAHAPPAAPDRPGAVPPRSASRSAAPPRPSPPAPSPPAAGSC